LSKHKAVSLKFLFAASFLCQMLMGAVGIAVPIYANRLNASSFLVGLIGSAGGLIYSFMPLISGVLCDRFKRKAFISASLLSYSLSCLLYSLVEQPYMLALIRVLECSSIAAFWPAMEALVADSAEVSLEETLKKFNVSWGSALAIGPIVGGFLISMWSIRATFLFSVWAALSSGLLGFILIVEPTRRGRVEAQPMNELKGDVGSKGSIATALSSIFLFSSIVGIIVSLFPSYATDLGILPFEIGCIAFGFGVARTLTFYEAYKIEARLGKLGMFLLGSFTLALASLLASASTSILVFLVCFIIFGFGSAICYAASISFILRRWGSSRGVAAGVFESLIGLGYFIGPLVGGIVSEHAPNAPFIYGFILSIVVLTFQLMFRGKSHKPSLARV